MSKEVSVLGIDLAKSSFSLHGIDKEGRKVVSRKVNRYELVESWSGFLGQESALFKVENGLKQGPVFF